MSLLVMMNGSSTEAPGSVTTSDDYLGPAIGPDSGLGIVVLGALVLIFSFFLLRQAIFYQARISDENDSQRAYDGVWMAWLTSAAILLFGFFTQIDVLSVVTIRTKFGDEPVFWTLLRLVGQKSNECTLGLLLSSVLPLGIAVFKFGFSGAFSPRQDSGREIERRPVRLKAIWGGLSATITLVGSIASIIGLLR